MSNDTRIKVIPLSKGDLIQSTYHMDAAEFGAYVRLLLVHYDNPDGLPDDDRLLARWAGCTAKVWKRVRPVVIEKFQRVEEPGRAPKLVQRRTVEEIQMIRERSSNQRDKALKRWDTPDAAASVRHQSGNATPSPSTKPQPEPKGLQTPNSNTNTATPAVDNSGGSLDKSGSGGALGFKIIHHLSDSDIAAARKKADGWDVYLLMARYDEGINNGSRDKPRSPAKAFLAWLPYYTKGKGPN